METSQEQPSTGMEMSQVQPSTVMETSQVQPSTVMETSQVQPSTVMETSQVQPSTVMETSQAARGEEGLDLDVRLKGREERTLAGALLAAPSPEDARPQAASRTKPLSCCGGRICVPTAREAGVRSTCGAGGESSEGELRGRKMVWKLCGETAFLKYKE